MGWQERKEPVGRLEILPQAPTVRCWTRLFRRRRGAAVSRQNTSCTFSEKSISARPPGGWGYSQTGRPAFLKPDHLAAADRPSRQGRPCQKEARSQGKAGRSQGQTTGAGKRPPEAALTACGGDAGDPKKSLRDPGDPPEPARRRRRQRLIQAAEELSRKVGVAPACDALSVSPASLYRWRQAPTTRVKRRSHQALAPPEQQAVLDLLHCERFMDKAPPQVWAELLDEGLYFCSLSTMYRILKAHEEVRERRNQLRHPNHPAPRLVATAPNQVWSWDITKLLGPCQVDVLLSLRAPWTSTAAMSSAGWSHAWNQRCWPGASSRRVVKNKTLSGPIDPTR